VTVAVVLEDPGAVCQARDHPDIGVAVAVDVPQGHLALPDPAGRQPLICRLVVHRCRRFAGLLGRRAERVTASDTPCRDQTIDDGCTDDLHQPSSPPVPNSPWPGIHRAVWKKRAGCLPNGLRRVKTVAAGRAPARSVVWPGRRTELPFGISAFPLDKM